MARAFDQPMATLRETAFDGGHVARRRPAVELAADKLGRSVGFRVGAEGLAEIAYTQPCPLTTLCAADAKRG